LYIRRRWSNTYYVFYVPILKHPPTSASCLNPPL
jgi:hypothetical protein